jgi:DNA-binding transcriptional MocR family regulator
MIGMEHRFSRYANRIVPSAIRGLATMAKAADCISFGPGEPDPSLFPVAEVRDSLARILARPERARAALQYGPSEGDPALRDRICAYMRAKGVACERQNILLTNGAQQALDLVAELLVEPGASVLVQSPTYPGALQIFLAHGAQLRALEAAAGAAHDRPALIYAMSNFHNPTGATLSLAQRRDLVAQAQALDTILVEDDPYEVLRYEGEALPPLLAVDIGTRSIEEARTIYLGTFSKAVAPGFRVGWLVAPSAVVAKLALMKQSEDLQAGSLAQACLLDLFDGILNDHASRLREAYRIRRDTILSALQSELGNQASWVAPQGGFFIWLTLNAEVDAHALLSRAAAAGVTYVPGSAFQPDSRVTASLRLSFSAAPLERMEEGVRRLAKVLRESAAPV